ncbi:MULTISPECIES: hypothetical protein [unclassified Streptomyces]|uniref:hypothetical protein n=1 Tax=unclassified Streptomyces TaxID=2593676 RepID=UPI00278C190D|nr:MULTISPECIES: hypothetical protein [unclassified Streptomyces]
MSEDVAPDFPGVVTPPAPRLPLLTLEEAQDVVDVLAAVVSGGDVDVDLARCLLANLGSRVPSRDGRRWPLRGGLPDDPEDLASIRAMAGPR